MKRNLLVTIGAIIFGICGTIIAGETEIILKDDTGNSGFSVKDVNDNTYMRIQGNGKVRMGRDTTASGSFSTAMGQLTTASGIASMAMGNDTTASGGISTAMGNGTTASGAFSTVMGQFTTASGIASTAMGNDTDAGGAFSMAMGQLTTASGITSMAMGNNTTASGGISTAMGNGTTAKGSRSTAMGDNTTAESFAETVIGSFNTAYIPVSTINFNSVDRLFVIGNGVSANSRSDAMVVLKNGNTGIGISDPQQKLHVSGDFIRVDGAGNEQVYIGGDGAGNDVQVGSFDPNVTNVALFNEATKTRMNLFVKDLIATGTISEGSSRKLKEDIDYVSSKEAMETLNGLSPVKFKYKVDNAGEEHLGFIAEDVPDLVAVQDRKHLRTMDITAVLTKVVKEQQLMLKAQQKTISQLLDRVNKIEGRI